MRLHAGVALCALKEIRRATRPAHRPGPARCRRGDWQTPLIALDRLSPSGHTILVKAEFLHFRCTGSKDSAVRYRSFRSALL